MPDRRKHCKVKFTHEIRCADSLRPPRRIKVVVASWFHPTSTSPVKLSRPRLPAGFTRPELVSVLACTTVLSLLLLNVAGTTRASSNAARCFANFKAQGTAWTTFAHDNPTLPAVLQGGEAFAALPTRSDYWVTGWLDWTLTPENTNRARLRSPTFATYLPGGLKAPNDFAVFRCPEDRYWSRAQVARGWPATGPGRVRSYSQNAAVGPGSAVQGLLDPAFRQVSRLSEINDPAGVFFLTEEHPDSINDPAWIPPRAGQWIDVLAAFHDRGAHFAFADGHSEHRRFQSPQNIIPVRFSFSTPRPNLRDPDQVWVSERTPRRQ